MQPFKIEAYELNPGELGDLQLVEVTDGLVKKERSLLLIMLEHFSEIERRRLYSDYQYTSLFDMLTARYGYTERQAYTRINAMKMLREIPEIEEKIQSGALNLTNLCLAPTLFKHENFDDEQKRGVLNKLSNLSTREAIRVAHQISTRPEMLRPDRVAQLTATRIEIRFTASNELPRKMDQLRGALAHTHPRISLGDLFEKACELALEHLVAAAPKKSCVKKRECEICSSVYALELDHIIPKAKGGDDSEENLRTLCRKCNQRAAFKHYGQPKMDPHIN